VVNKIIRPRGSRRKILKRRAEDRGEHRQVANALVDLKEAATMVQDNEYVQKLIAARDREVAHRRDIAVGGEI